MTASNPTSKKPIRLFKIPFDEPTLLAIAEVLESGNVMMGSKVQELEACIAKHQGVEPDQVVAVNSGSSALDLSLGCTPAKNYKVLIPGLSMVAAAHAIQRNGLIPKIIDVDANLMANTEILEEAWTKDTGGVVITDYGGRTADLHSIMDWSHDNGKDIFVWNDCAHSFGSEGAGTLADVACFSLYPTKPLPGIGGGIVVNNLKDVPRIQRRIRELRYYGITDRDGWDYDVRRLGGNFYMSDVQAAVALSFLKREHLISDHIRARTRVAMWYHTALEEAGIKDGVRARRHVGYVNDNYDAYHLFPVVLDAKIDRTALQLHLKALGIETGVHYKPLQELSLYRNAVRAPTPYLDSIGPRLLSLPCHHEMDCEEVYRVVESIKNFIKRS